MKYQIKNKKYNTYYSRKILNFYHFVREKTEAHIFEDKKEAKKIMKLFKNKDNFEIVRG